MLLVSNREEILAVENVSFSYNGETDVLKDVSLSVMRGDYLGLIGPNGGGKTTLVKIMLGLLRASCGSARLFGISLRDSRERHKIGYVSQTAVKFDSLFPATVEEVVRMGRYGKRGLFRRLTAEDHAKTEEALAQVDMLAFRNRRVNDLSGGQKQRVFIARALAGEPSVIVLDEPTTGVDEETQEQFYTLLKDLNQRLTLTLVLVSHDLDRIAKEVSCIAVIDTTLRYYDNPADAVALERSIEAHH